MLESNNSPVLKERVEDSGSISVVSITDEVFRDIALNILGVEFEWVLKVAGLDACQRFLKAMGEVLLEKLEELLALLDRNKGILEVADFIKCEFFLKEIGEVSLEKLEELLALLDRNKGILEVAGLDACQRFLKAMGEVSLEKLEELLALLDRNKGILEVASLHECKYFLKEMGEVSLEKLEELLALLDRNKGILEVADFIKCEFFLKEMGEVSLEKLEELLALLDRNKGILEVAGFIKCNEFLKEMGEVSLEKLEELLALLDRNKGILEVASLHKCKYFLKEMGEVSLEKLEELLVLLNRNKGILEVASLHECKYFLKEMGEVSLENLAILFLYLLMYNQLPSVKEYKDFYTLSLYDDEKYFLDCFYEKNLNEDKMGTVVYDVEKVNYFCEKIRLAWVSRFGHFLFSKIDWDRFRVSLLALSNLYDETSVEEIIDAMLKSILEFEGDDFLLFVLQELEKHKKLPLLTGVEYQEGVFRSYSHIYTYLRDKTEKNSHNEEQLLDIFKSFYGGFICIETALTSYDTMSEELTVFQSLIEDTFDECQYTDLFY